MPPDAHSTHCRCVLGRHALSEEGEGASRAATFAAGDEWVYQSEVGSPKVYSKGKTGIPISYLRAGYPALSATYGAKGFRYSGVDTRDAPPLSSIDAFASLGVGTLACTTRASRFVSLCTSRFRAGR